jgi:hypothetical protein
LPRTPNQNEMWRCRIPRKRGDSGDLTMRLQITKLAVFYDSFTKKCDG